MRLIFFCILVAASISMSSCSTPTPNGSNVEPATNDSTLPPVETDKPNAEYSPAFPGQTRIAGVRTKTPIESTVISTDLKRPWGIVSLPDGRLLVTQKEGTMCIVTTEGKIVTEITGLPPVNSSGQGGLLGLALDPQFSSNRMVYWAFSENLANGTVTAVAKGKLSTNEKVIENHAVIYRAMPAYKGTLHYGGRVLFDKNGHLFVSTGERSDRVTRPQAQQLNSALGKVLRITTDGKAVEGNPFINTPNAMPEIYSYGHRNAQGLAFHPETGDLWENEFGPRGGDELNLIQPGKNYGWPAITYGLEYSGDKIGPAQTQAAGMEQPVYYWDPVLSPSGMTFYSGSKIPEWRSNLFLAGLNSYHIARLVIKNNRVVGEERLVANDRQRFRDITEGKDGALYAITDAGRLYRIAKK